MQATPHKCRCTSCSNSIKLELRRFKLLMRRHKLIKLKLRRKRRLKLKRKSNRKSKATCKPDV
jgi:hypothetical protein